MRTPANVRYGDDRLTRDEYDAKVARMHAKKRDDRWIAFATGTHPKTVSTSRRRQGLEPLYGPGGRPWKTQVAA